MTIGMNPKCVFNLDPGVYLFSSMSGAGKTYLLSRLQPARESGVILLCRQESDIVVKPGIKLAIFDRADRYKTSEVFHKAVEELRHTAIVLLDCKEDIGFISWRRRFIVLNISNKGQLIEVSPL